MKKAFSIFLVLLLLLTYWSSMNMTRANHLDLSTVTIPLIIEKSKNVTEYTYTQKIQPKQATPLSFSQEYWVKNGNARVETTLFESNLPLYTHGLIIQDGQKEPLHYQIKHQKDQSNSKSTSSILTVGQSEGIRGQTFLHIIDQLNSSSSQIIGLERIESRPCIVVQYKDGKVWIDGKYYVPVRTENLMGIIEYKNIKVGAGSVKDKDLQMPANAR